MFWDGPQAAQRLRIEFADGKVALLQERGNTDRDLPLLRIEPPVIGGIYPGHNEDRALLKLAQVPKPLIDALIAVEDRKYYSHWGIDPRGIARALYKTRHRTAHRRWQHAHPATRQEFLPDFRTHPDAQGHRSADGAAAGDALQQGRNSRNLSQ